VLTHVDGDGWREALAEYKAVADDLHAGRKPRETTNGLTVADLCNRFLTAKTHALDAGEIGARTFADYKAFTDRLVSTFGKGRPVDDLRADDFEALRAGLAKQYGPVRLGNEIQRVRTVFKYGYEAGLIDRPVRFGPQFKKPSANVLRKHRAAGGTKMFEAEELRRLIDAAGVQLRAMILLGVNAGFGNSDCGTLPLSALDLKGGWVRFPRPKTGVERRCPLWPETVEALRAALARRPTPKDDADTGTVFVTKYGSAWASEGSSDAVKLEFGKLLRKVGLNRPGVGFYALRHTFRTVADATRDFPAVRMVMGHADDSIDQTYRERIDDERLHAVAGYVRRWLFGGAESGDGADAPARKN
jgi:integrase